VAGHAHELRPGIEGTAVDASPILDQLALLVERVPEEQPGFSSREHDKR